MKWKAFSQGSLRALLSKIVQIKKAVDANASTVSDLGDDLARLSELTAESVAAKQDKPTAVSCTIPATSWGKDSTTGYPHYYDIPAPGATARDRAEVAIAPDSLPAAADCGLCPTCQTLAGKIRLRAASAPTAAITAEYWLEQGKE